MTKRLSILFLMIVASISFNTRFILANTPEVKSEASIEKKQTDEEIMAEAREKAEDEEKGHHPHHVSFGAGGASIDRDTYIFIGLDYEYRLPFLKRLFGLLAIGEFTFASPDAISIVAGGIVIHPIYDLKLLAAAGVEIEGSHAPFLFRAGAGYDIHLTKHLVMTPLVYMDLVEGHISWVYGLGFGVGF